MSLSSNLRKETEPPSNGLKGLKHWRQDMLAGLVVALVSVPLSLGIALASGAPPICGIWSEVIAGLVIPFLGGSYVAISGPAAGLAPAIYTGILTLGHGNLEKGYRLMTGAIMLVGIFQIILTWCKAARFSYVFPSAAIQGMLSSIGFLLIAKQIPNFIGQKYEAHEFWSMVFETPQEFVNLHPKVFAISCISLALLFIIPNLRGKIFRQLPPQLIVVIVAAIMGKLWGLDEKFLVLVPDNPLQNGIVPPDFQALFSDPSLVGSIFMIVLTLAFIDGTESLATIFAVDKIDPWHRKSNPDRTLFAMGVSNILSSIIGGLTIIPGIIKSTTNIQSGGRTSWTNFYNAIFLIIFLLLASGIIHMIPLGALAAVLVHIGWKLAGPHKWRLMFSLGSEQALIYVTTILVTVSSDLMLGIIAGILLKLIILIAYNSKATHGFNFSIVSSLFKNPVSNFEETDKSTILHICGPVVCFNSLSFRAACEKAYLRRKPIIVQVNSTVNVIDHSSSLYLQSFKQDCERAGINFSMTGLRTLKARTEETSSLKFRPAPLPEPIEGMHILLVVDHTEHSNVAVQEVKNSLWPSGSQLVVAHVLSSPLGMKTSEQHEEKANQLVNGIRDQIKEANKAFSEVESIVLFGEPKNEILALLQQLHSDLLVTGTRGAVGLSRMFLGSLSHKLLMTAHCPVRVCRNRRSQTGHKVMLALDDSRSAIIALEQMGGRVWPEGTEFICVSALPSLAEYSHRFQDSYAISELESNRTKLIQSIKVSLDSAEEFLKTHVKDCTVKTMIVDGDPREVLVKVADEAQVDLIVLGSAGKVLAERLMVGSVSEIVANYSSCSVEVICQTVRERSGANQNGNGNGNGDH
ncbi:MAG: SulP family inorganic anion transporter [Candidatus Melainabacteria bacterium]|nr:SulP family inorganic anion transporter [Candidatus Melainabacteria bacterium]